MLYLGGIMGKTLTLMTKLVTSIFICSTLLTATTSAAFATSNLSLSVVEISADQRTTPQSSTSFSLPSMRSEIAKPDSELQLNEVFTLGGLALAASGLVELRRRQKEVKGA